MTSFPIFVEQRPPRPARDDGNGLIASRRASILTTSRVAALIAARNYGMYRGAPYREPGGGIPDPFCLCQSIEAVGKPDAIAGGLGQYILEAEYARQQTVPQAQPGSGVRWRRVASLISQPVDLDAVGKPITSSAHEPVDPPLTALLTQVTFHGEFYVEGDDELEAVAPFAPFEGKVNRGRMDALGIYGEVPWCLLVHPFVTQPSDTGWIFMSVDIEYRAPKRLDGKGIIGSGWYGGWEDVFPDRGRRKLVNGGGGASTASQQFGWILDADGRPIGDPLPLDGAGNEATGTTPGPGGTVGNQALIAVMNYEDADLNKIPFPED